MSRNGSAWESNPPTVLVAPSTGFEDRGPHQGNSHFQNNCALAVCRGPRVAAVLILVAVGRQGNSAIQPFADAFDDLGW